MENRDNTVHGIQFHSLIATPKVLPITKTAWEGGQTSDFYAYVLLLNVPSAKNLVDNSYVFPLNFIRKRKT